MDAAAPRKRRRWPWLAALAALGLGGYVGLRSLMEPERLSAFLLQQAEVATGLSFELDRPADIGFWPDLHLVLHGLTVRAPNDEASILRGHRVEIVLPWSALRGDTLRLRELRLTPMALDVDALLRWMDSRAELGPPAPLRLPQLDAGLVVSRSRITYGDWVLADVDMNLTGLRNGEASTATLSAILGGPEVRRPFNLMLHFVPQQMGDEIRFDPLALMSRDAPSSDPWFEAKGRAVLDHPRSLRFTLETRLPRWRAEWPTLPLPDAPTAPVVTIDLDYAGTPQLQGSLDVRLARADESIDAKFELGDILAWIADPGANPLPPVRGRASADRMQFDGVELRGVSLRLEYEAEAKPDAAH